MKKVLAFLVMLSAVGPVQAMDLYPELNNSDFLNEYAQGNGINYEPVIYPHLNPVQGNGINNQGQAMGSEHQSPPTNNGPKENVDPLERGSILGHPGSWLALLGAAVAAYKMHSYATADQYEQNVQALQLLERWLVDAKQIHDITRLYKQLIEPNLTLLTVDYKKIMEDYLITKDYNSLSLYIINICYDALNEGAAYQVVNKSYPTRWQRIKNSARADFAIGWKLIDTWHSLQDYLFGKRAN